MTSNAQEMLDEYFKIRYKCENEWTVTKLSTVEYGRMFHDMLVRRPPWYSSYARYTNDGMYKDLKIKDRIEDRIMRK